MPRNGNRDEKVTPESSARLEKAMQMLIDGCSFEEIAKICGWNSPQAAHKAIKTALKRRVNLKVDELREVQTRRQSELLTVLLPKARGGNLRAVDRVLKIDEFLSRLHGTHAPTKIAETDIRGKDKPAANRIQIYIPDNERDPKTDR